MCTSTGCSPIAALARPAVRAARRRPQRAESAGRVRSRPRAPAPRRAPPPARGLSLRRAGTPVTVSTTRGTSGSRLEPPNEVDRGHAVALVVELDRAVDRRAELLRRRVDVWREQRARGPPTSRVTVAAHGAGTAIVTTSVVPSSSLARRTSAARPARHARRLGSSSRRAPPVVGSRVPRTYSYSSQSKCSPPTSASARATAFSRPRSRRSTAMSHVPPPRSYSANSSPSSTGSAPPPTWWAAASASSRITVSGPMPASWAAARSTGRLTAAGPAGAHATGHVSATRAGSPSCSTAARCAAAITWPTSATSGSCRPRSVSTSSPLPTIVFGVSWPPVGSAAVASTAARPTRISPAEVRCTAEGIHGSSPKPTSWGSSPARSPAATVTVVPKSSPR